MTVLCASPRCRSLGQHATACDDDTCRGCLPRTAADGMAICHVCTRRLGEDITTAAELHAELGLALTTPERPGERVTGGGVKRSVSLNERAMHSRTRIHVVLASWARMVAEERGIRPPLDAPAAIGSWLSRHVGWLSAHGAAGDCCDEFGDLAHGEPYRVAYPTGARVFVVAACPVVEDEVRCGGEIKAILRRVDALLPSELVCSADDTHRWNSSAWIKLGRKLWEDKAA